MDCNWTNLLSGSVLDHPQHWGPDFPRADAGSGWSICFNRGSWGHQSWEPGFAYGTLMFVQVWISTWSLKIAQSGLWHLSGHIHALKFEGNQRMSWGWKQHPRHDMRCMSIVKVLDNLKALSLLRSNFFSIFNSSVLLNPSPVIPPGAGSSTRNLLRYSPNVWCVS